MQPQKIQIPPEDVQNLSSIDRSIEARSLELGKMSIQLREMESGLAKLYDFRREIIKKHLDGLDIPDGVRAHVTQTGPNELTVIFLDDPNRAPSEPEPSEPPPLNSESG